MKTSGRTLGRRLMLLGDRLSRLKHRKGHGVHSPFVYGFVRKVLMSKALCEGPGTALCDSLLANGVAHRRAKELHNLLVYIEGQSYSINEVEGDLSILLADYPTEKLAAALATKSVTNLDVASVTGLTSMVEMALRMLIPSFFDNIRSSTRISGLRSATIRRVCSPSLAVPTT